MAEEPFVTLGIVATIFWFSWFLIIVPVIGIVENAMADVANDR